MSDINRVLRSDVVRCTTWGILQSASRGRERFSDVRRGGDALPEDIYCRIHLPHTFSNRGFEWQSYGVTSFARLRDIFGVAEDDFKRSFELPAVGEAEISERFTEGRSGSFFYYTTDGRFLVKTLTKSECNHLRRHLPAWLAHFSAFPQSLLTRFCGLHAIRLSPEQRWFYFCVMESVFAGIPASLTIEEKYDLKGSWAGRRAIKNPNVLPEEYGHTMKDGDLREPLDVGPHMARRLCAQLLRDARFLSTQNIMDYSLLVGVHRLKADGSVDDGEAAAAMARSSRERLNLLGLNRQRLLRTGEEPISALSASLAPPTSKTWNRGGSASRRLVGDLAVLASAGPDDDRDLRSLRSTAMSDRDRASSVALSGTGQDEFGGREGQGDVLRAQLDDEDEAEASKIDAEAEEAVENIIGFSLRSKLPQRPWHAEAVVPQQRLEAGGLGEAATTRRYPPRIFVVGVIDVLQRYDWLKKLERWVKIVFRGKDPAGISACPPDEYLQRFVARMAEIFV